MKYFVISDIHSHYSAMIESLRKKEYNPNNSAHHLIVLGDLFDRGYQTVDVLDYLYNLYLEDKVTIVVGNHDTFLIDFLNGDHNRTYFNCIYNGFDKTLYQLSGTDPTIDNLSEIQSVINKNYPHLLGFLNQFHDYLEIGDYIFVHGGIDGSVSNWREKLTTHDFVWGREINCKRIPNKIVVAGHHRVSQIRVETKNHSLLFQLKPEMFDILYEDGKILIDRFVEVTNELNVLVIEI